MNVWSVTGKKPILQDVRQCVRLIFIRNLRKESRIVGSKNSWGYERVYCHPIIKLWRATSRTFDGSINETIFPFGHQGSSKCRQLLVVVVLCQFGVNEECTKSITRQKRERIEIAHKREIFIGRDSFPLPPPVETATSLWSPSLVLGMFQPWRRGFFRMALMAC